MPEVPKLGIFSNHILFEKIQNSHVYKYVEMQQSTHTYVSLKGFRELTYRNKGDLVGGKRSFPKQKPLKEKLPFPLLWRFMY